jgi:hypothetical protein
VCALVLVWYSGIDKNIGDEDAHPRHAEKRGYANFWHYLCNISFFMPYINKVRNLTTTHHKKSVKSGQAIINIHTKHTKNLTNQMKKQ